MSPQILVLADIHGNLNALKAVLRDAAGKYSEIWVLGDIMGYGPDPESCLNLLRNLDAVMIAGNHDLAACGAIDMEQFSSEARKVISLQKKNLSESQRDFLMKLPLIRTIGSVTLIHGDPENPIWGYVFGKNMASRILSHTQTSLTLTGHTHVPAMYAYDAEFGTRTRVIQYGVEMDYTMVPHLANPGSVGQSRERDIAARYMLLKPERKKITFNRCMWNTGPIRKKMFAAGYPQTLIDRMAPKRTSDISRFRFFGIKHKGSH